MLVQILKECSIWKLCLTKKDFFRLSIGSIFLQTVAVFFIISSIVLPILFTNKLIFNSINGSFDGYTVFVTIVCYLAFPMLVKEELNFIVDNICLKEDCVYAHGDFKNKRYKAQYQTKINYGDIVGVEINALRANSKGQFVPLLRPAPFLVLTNKKGKILICTWRMKNWKLFIKWYNICACRKASIREISRDE